jgi:hypothetical protein
MPRFLSGRGMYILMGRELVGRDYALRDRGKVSALIGLIRNTVMVSAPRQRAPQHGDTCEHTSRARQPYDLLRPDNRGLVFTGAIGKHRLNLASLRIEPHVRFRLTYPDLRIRGRVAGRWLIKHGTLGAKK